MKIKTVCDLENVCRELTMKGRLIEAGWVTMRTMSITDNASQEQLDEMRSAFFAGAKHAFSCLVVDAADMPTKRQMEKLLTALDNEINTFVREYQLKHIPTEGNA
jgi:hypothetical protein